MNEIEIAEIEQRANAATPGPWEFWWRSGGFVSNGIYDIAKVFILEDDCDFEKNGIFISHARDDIPTLIAEVRRLRAVLAEYADKNVWGGGSLWMHNEAGYERAENALKDGEQ